MSTPNSKSHDVIIAGAGPVGLFLACELGMAGCSVLVLEQARERQTPLKRAPFGLRGITAPTIESFDRRDLLQALLARIDTDEIAAAASWMREQRRPGGHFAGIDFYLDMIDQSQWPFRLPGAVSHLAADLDAIETVLEARATELGVSIRRGCSVSSLETTADDLVVSAGEETFRAQWLVGCDGARSVVRRAAGFGFAGTEPEFTGYFVQVELADPDSLALGHHDTDVGTYIYELPGMLRMVEFDGAAFHRTQPITRDHVQEVLQRISGVPVEVAALGMATTWTDRAYLATEYRKGRVFLAGDAAHIHSPLGGQGLNLGVGDAMNLGWKLAATIRGAAASDLLDSYKRERRPVAEQILDWSRAQVALMRPSRSSQALRAIVSDLIETNDGATYFAERVWGVGLRYDLEGDHPLVGRSAPDFAFSDWTRLNERLRSGQALLVDFEGCADLRALADNCTAGLAYLRCQAVDQLGLNAVLLRPDGIVAWASSSLAELHDAARALLRVGVTMRPGIPAG